jgi:ATP-binding cassette subfamily F protein 3
VGTSAPTSTNAPGFAKRSGAGGRTPSTLRRLIQDADKELVRLAKRRTALEAEVTAAAEAGDHGRLSELGRDLADVDAQVAEVEERWLELGAELEAR